MPNNGKQTFNLEETLNQLETITEKLESKEISLEESLKLFEQGIGLVRQAKKTLDTAEQKIQKLTQDQTSLEPYETESDND